jgi:CO/xanthine dehydrogenase FAD-binding subunit
VELASQVGVRRMPIAAYVLGNRRTAKRADELVTGLTVVPGPLPGTTVRSVFEKLGSRAYLVISIAMVAAVVEIDPGGAIARARVAVGACSEVAQRLPGLEAELVGLPADAATARIIRPEHIATLTPIDDVRGSADYRRDAALTVVRRALERALAGPAS